MDKDFLKEKVGYYKTLVTLIWTSIFLVGSGMGWVLISLKELRLYLMPAGTLFEIALISGFIFFDGRIRKLLKELNNNDNN